MLKFFDIYWCYIKIFFKSRAEYRTSFVLGLLSNFYCYFISYATYWILITSLGDINGWDFSDLSILYGFSILTYSISGVFLWYTVYNMEVLITTGELDMYLTRPLGVLQQMIYQRFGDTFIGQIIVTIIFMIVAFINKVQYITPLFMIYLIFSIIGGVLIQSGSMIFIGSLSFWTHRSTEIGELFYYNIRSMTQYPLTIFPKRIQWILTFVFPWGFINYYPSIILLNKVRNKLEFLLGVTSPIIGVIFLFLALFVFKTGLKKYTSVGN